MMDVGHLQGQNFLVLGHGKTGQSVVGALKQVKKNVVIWDDKQERTPDIDYDILDAVIASPGIAQDHPVKQQALQKNIEIIGDMEIFGRCYPDAKIIAITGTNGKSTTTALIHHILDAAGVSAHIGGNIGTPVLDLPTPQNGDEVYVLEMSSYQIDLCVEFHADIAVHLNLSPDHIERYGSMDAYAASKARLMDGPGIGVIGLDDEYSCTIADQVKQQGRREVIGISVDLAAPEFADITTLKGRHNKQNMLAARAACRAYGLDDGVILEGIKTFPGLNHRQFRVVTINNTTFINDSKATNVDATGYALRSYENIYWIVGGQAKEGGLNGLEDDLSAVKKAYVIGDATDEFMPWLDAHEVDAKACYTLTVAVDSAYADALESKDKRSVILLSPACASWDQFKSFEERGDVFAEIVGTLR